MSSSLIPLRRKRFLTIICDHCHTSVAKQVVIHKGLAIQSEPETDVENDPLSRSEYRKDVRSMYPTKKWVWTLHPFNRHAISNRHVNQYWLKGWYNSSLICLLSTVIFRISLCLASFENKLLSYCKYLGISFIPENELLSLIHSALVPYVILLMYWLAHIYYSFKLYPHL